jgi:hypothetical protein
MQDREKIILSAPSLYIVYSKLRIKLKFYLMAFDSKKQLAFK